MLNYLKVFLLCPFQKIIAERINMYLGINVLSVNY